MGLPELTAKIKSKNITGVYFFYGDEEYTKDFQIRKLRSFIPQSASREYADIVFDGSVLNIRDFSDAVYTPSFLSEWKIVEVNNFPLNQSPSMLNDLSDILYDVPEGVAIIFIYRSGELDSSAFEKAKDNAFVDFIKNSAVTVHFEEQTGDKLVQWIIKHFKSENVHIEPSAVAFLPEYCGNDMYLLSGEISKLCSYYNGNVLTVEDIKRVCCENNDYKLYDVINCLSQKNAQKLKYVYDGLVYSKTAPEMILGTVAGYFVDMLNIKTAANEGMAPSEVKKRLCMADWQYNRSASASRNLSEKFLRNAVSECLNADIIVKSHASDAYVMIEIMLYRIMMYGKDNKKA